MNAWCDISPACGVPPIGTSFIDAYSTTCLGANFATRGTFLAAPFTTYLVRAMTIPGGFGTYTLTIKTPTTGAQTFIGFSSPFGPGSIQANLGGLPLNGLYFFPVSLAATTPTTPSFYGINMTTAQLLAEFNIGFPFAGGVDACGNAQIGPFSGIPTGTIGLRRGSRVRGRLRPAADEHQLGDDLHGPLNVRFSAFRSKR